MKKMMRDKKAILVFAITFSLLFNMGIFGRGVRAGEIYDAKHNIPKLEDKLEEANKQLKANQTQYQINQAQINTTKNIITKTQREILEKKQEIEDLEKRIEFNKEILKNYLQEMSVESFDNSATNFAFSGFTLDEFSGNFYDMVSVKEKVLAVLEQIIQDKEDLNDTKKELDRKKEENQKYLAAKQNQQIRVASDIQETKLTISQLQAKLAHLRSILSRFLGENFSMDDVIDAVKYADKKTGVRKEFLFAILDKETDLGRYTGGCTYKKSKMGDTNADYFKDICKDLGYDYKKMKVSCPLSYGIGGAMGVAQFMPSTWMGYKDKIAKLTGHDPADPWNLEDGIMGMALYLKNKGGDKKSGEHTAAAAYYCGSNLSRTVCQNYANTVISWSKGYDEYF